MSIHHYFDVRQGWCRCDRRCDDHQEKEERIDWRSFYSPIRSLPTGVNAGIQDMVYTAGLFVGMDENGYRTRYCYATRAQAEAALNAWDGKGDPPGPWIKQKPEDRLGPGATE